MILVRFGIVYQLIVTAFGAIIHWELAAILDALIAAYPKFLLNKFISIVLILMMKIYILNRMIILIILNQ